MTVLHVLTPCFNDGEALHRLLAELDEVGRGQGYTLHVTVVDDGSIPPVRVDEARLRGWPAIAEVTLLRLAANAGHQRALAVGLADLGRQDGVELVVVMDSDGEDRPADLPRLLEHYRRSPGAVVVAHRAKRSEGLAFRFGYAAFKLFYRLLTGRGISFGNFMLLDAPALHILSHRGELWASLPATVMRARLRHRLLPTERGHRYCGASRMNFAGLILHGLASISVFGDIALVRALMFTLVLTLLAGSGVAVVVGVRLFTPYAIPGWATSSVLALSIIGLQGLLSTMSLVFILLNGQRGGSPIPHLAAQSMIDGRQRIVAEHELT
jgi:glycosyltransferase involved in cell wall biosynthesis